jgi:hypothetical protein
VKVVTGRAFTAARRSRTLHAPDFSNNDKAGYVIEDRRLTRAAPEPWVKLRSAGNISADGVGWIAVVLAAAVAAAVVASWFHPASMFNDSFQLASVARSLLDGHGIATSIVYYDTQYAAGTMPAPQTVWPPGMPFAAAGLALLGLDLDRAMFAVSLAGYVASPFLVALVLRRAGASATQWVLAALVPLLVVGNGYFAARAGTEGPFIAFSLLALLGFVMPPGRRTGRAVAIAARATGAVAFRYAGLFLLAAVAASFAIEAFATRSRVPLRDGVVALVVPVIFASALLVRNVVDAGNASGGMEPREWADAGAVLKSTVAAAVALTGLTLQATLQRVAVLALAGFIAVSLARGAWLAARESTAVRRRAASETLPGFRAWILCASYSASTVAALVFMTFERGADTLVDRYFFPLVPFVAIACALAWVPGAISTRTGKYVSTHSPWVRAALGISAILAFVSLAIGQQRQFERYSRELKFDAARDVVTLGLARRFQGDTVAGFLEKHASFAHPVLSSSGQLVGGLTHVPVVALAPTIFSARRWTTDEVQVMVARYGVCRVLLHARDTEGGASGGRQFFADLRAGRVAQWLRLDFSSPEIVVYGVRMRGCDGR